MTTAVIPSSRVVTAGGLPPGPALRELLKHPDTGAAHGLQPERPHRVARGLRGGAGLGAAVDLRGAREHGPADLDEEAARDQESQHRTACVDIEGAQTRRLSLG